jgi:hypothetical protein
MIYLTASQPRFVLLRLSIFLLLPACPAPSQEPNEAELYRFKHGVVAVVPGDAEIEHLIKQLGDSDFRTREAATKRLSEIGEPALGAKQGRNERRCRSAPPCRGHHRRR